MTKLMKQFDRAALMMIGVGLGGGMLGVVQFIAPWVGVAFWILFVVGIATEIVVLRSGGSMFDNHDNGIPEPVASAHVPTLGTDPVHPDAVGSFAWREMRKGTGTEM